MAVGILVKVRVIYRLQNTRPHTNNVGEFFLSFSKYLMANTAENHSRADSSSDLWFNIGKQ